MSWDYMGPIDSVGPTELLSWPWSIPNGAPIRPITPWAVRFSVGSWAPGRYEHGLHVPNEQQPRG